MAYNPNDEAPAERPLKACVRPVPGRNLGNYMTVNVRNEASDDPPTVLMPGPVGKYLAVIVPWDSIPRMPLMDRLGEMTQNRVVRSDSLKLTGTNGAPKGPQLAEMPKGFVQGEFWYDYLVKLK